MRKACCAVAQGLAGALLLLMLLVVVPQAKVAAALALADANARKALETEARAEEAQHQFSKVSHHLFHRQTCSKTWQFLGLHVPSPHSAAVSLPLTRVPSAAMQQGTA